MSPLIFSGQISSVAEMSDEELLGENASVIAISDFELEMSVDKEAGRTPDTVTRASVKIISRTYLATITTVYKIL